MGRPALSFISMQGREDSQWNKYVEAIRAGAPSPRRYTYPLHDTVADGLFKRICPVIGREWSEEAEREWVAGLFKSPRASQECLCIPSRAGGATSPTTSWRPAGVCASPSAMYRHNTSRVRLVDILQDRRSFGALN